jgi:integrase
MEQLALDFEVGSRPNAGGGGGGLVPVRPTPPATTIGMQHKTETATSVAPPPPRTLADVLAVVRAVPDLMPSRRRDLVSALTSISRMSRRSLACLPVEPRELRAVLDNIHPAAFEVSAKRFSNMRSDLRRALDLAAGVRRNTPAGDVLSEAWRALRTLCPSPWTEVGLLGFMRWCSGQGIAPAAVDDATLAAYVAQRDRQDLKVDLPQVRRQVAGAWNTCVDAVPDWPRQRLNHVPARPRWTLPWSAFRPEFLEDVDRWAERLGGADLFDEDAPDKPLRPISIKQSRYCVQMAASTLVASGVPLDGIRALRDLATPERMAAVLHRLRDRYGHQSATPYRVAVTLTAAAEYYIKVDDEQVGRLRRMCRRVLVKRRGMTPKNKKRLAPFADPDTRDRFLLLPAELMRSAEREARSPRQAAVLAQMAVVLEIAQMAPMRARNLAALELNRHLTFVGHGRHEYALIAIPEEETKNELALDYPLSPESTRLIRRYIEHYLPVLSPGESRFLFPGGKGGAKLASSLSNQVERTIRNSIGYRVNLHLLRHFAAMIFLVAFPGAYEAVRRLLGHATASAALDMYVGLETAAAVRQFDEVILRQRQLAVTRAKAQLGRGGRR